MKKILLTTLLGLSMLALKSQSYSYEFDYDDAGNRTRRTVITIPDKALDQQADEENPDQKADPSKVLREDLFDGKEIAIYPNPTTGELILEISPLESDVSGNISIYSISGDLLIVTKVIDEMNTLDLSGLLPGNYILKIVLDEKAKTYKIIKQ